MAKTRRLVIEVTLVDDGAWGDEWERTAKDFKEAVQDHINEDYGGNELYDVCTIERVAVEEMTVQPPPVGPTWRVIASA